MKSRRWWGWIAALAIPASASAQNAARLPTFALPSLAGDQFTVVGRQDENGSRLEQNTRPSTPAVHPKSVVLAWDALTAEPELAALECNLRSAVETETTVVLAD